jgi:hypothetical protein
MVQEGESVPDLIAIGPGVVFVGELLSIDNNEWSFHLRHFVAGGLHALIEFIERFGQTAAIDRHVIVSFLGDGWTLKATPSMAKDIAGGYIVRCPVLPRTARIRAADLPQDFDLSDNHDLTVKSGNISMVSGLEALPQLVKTCLSLPKGESLFHPDFGTRFAEYYRQLSGSPWLEHFLKLELIRQAAIPYTDTIMNRQYTPLQCVERVFGIELLANAPTKNWLPIRVDFDVKGVGRWQHDLSICIPQNPTKRPSFGKLLAGPSALEADSDVLIRLVEGDALQPAARVGSEAWRKQTARDAANARHDQPGGSRDKQRRIREIWASGKYSTRDLCAEEECEALGMSFSAARKALRNAPEPVRSID